jgi:uncharacterized protein
LHRYALSVLCLLIVQGQAWAQSATDASIRELLAVTQSQKLVDGMYEQMDGSLRAVLQQALGDANLAPAQQEILVESQSEMLALFEREMGWSVLEPHMIEVYRAHFSEAEIQGMLKFYDSEVGRSVIEKMPAVTQSFARIQQQQFAALMPQLLQIQRDAAARAKAVCQDRTRPGCEGAK